VSVNKSYTAEFRRDAVSLVRTSGRPIAQIARELGIDDATLGKWVRDDRKNNKKAGLGPGSEDAEMQEVRRLKKRIAELEMEREILKRAVVFWVKESNE
jgi:transposase